MMKKLLEFFKENGFLLLLFIAVCLVAAYTITVATKDLRQAEKIRDNDLVILEEIKDDMEDSPIDNIETSLIEKDEKDMEEGLGEEVENTNEEIESASLDSFTEDYIGFTEGPELEDESIEEESLEVEIDFISSSEEGKNSDKGRGIFPVEGDIIREFSSDSLIFFKTTQDWRAHLGMDIGSKEGSKVRAVLDGTIKEVFKDDLWGISIVIDHGDNLLSKYSYLGTSEMVKEGLKVKEGDTISIVGKPMGIEMDLQAHLHFEVIKDGKFVDPRSIIE